MRRFDQIIGRLQFIADHAVFQAGRYKDEDALAVLLPQKSGSLDAVHPGHIDVEQHNVPSSAVQGADKGFAVAKGFQMETPRHGDARILQRPDDLQAFFFQIIANGNRNSHFASSFARLLR